MSGSTTDSSQNNPGPLFIQHVARDYAPHSTSGPFLVGVLDGEGIGPEVVGRSLQILQSVSDVSGVDFLIEKGGPIGRESESVCGNALSQDVIEFCESVFARRGAVLAGAGGSRFVYDLRKQFDLFCKFVPIRSERPFQRLDPMAGGRSSGVDVVLIRENSGGIYQGRWDSTDGPSGRTATHTFEYGDAQVIRILEVAARLAQNREQRMTVVWKESGIPSISKLWRDCTEQIAGDFGIHWEMIDIDFAAYSMLSEPHRFDIVVAPNLFGDILGDLCAILSGSRGLSFSGNYDKDGHGVYQTNHGAAYDLAGTDRANPVGQILSLAMMLRESFGLAREARLIETSIRQVWADGWRTFDLSEEGCKVVGTRQMARLIAERIQESKIGLLAR